MNTKIITAILIASAALLLSCAHNTPHKLQIPADLTLRYAISSGISSSSCYVINFANREICFRSTLWPYAEGYKCYRLEESRDLRNLALATRAIAHADSAMVVRDRIIILDCGFILSATDGGHSASFGANYNESHPLYNFLTWTQNAVRKQYEPFADKPPDRTLPLGPGPDKYSPGIWPALYSK